MRQILIIDVAEKFCNDLSGALAHLGYQPVCCGTLQAALSALSPAIGVVVLNTRMPDGSGVDVITRIKQQPHAPSVFVVAEHPTADEAEESIKNGAWDYVGKSGSVRSLAAMIDRAAKYSVESEAPLATTEEGGGLFEGIVGNSPQLRACLDIVLRSANSDSNVLIKGETGTGKELIAWAIHRNSPRAGGNFVVVDCAALPETLVESTLLGHEKGSFTGADKAQTGLIKQADGGTLFLDEIGELPLSVQRSFLRVLEERRFRPVGGKEEIQSDFRLISASNRDLDEMVRRGEFREDLLFRLRSFAIEVPPLRQRMEDIKSLVVYYTPRMCERLRIGMKEISPEFYDALLRHSWPGNVRELVNSLERSLVAARTDPVLLPQHLPTYLRVQLARSVYQTDSTATGSSASSSLPPIQSVRATAIESAEREYLQSLIASTQGDIPQACKISGLSRSRLYSLLKKYGIQAPRYLI